MLHDRMTLMADDAGEAIHAASDQVATIYGLLAKEGLDNNEVGFVLDALSSAATELDAFVKAL